jgi:hypothetical protein
MEHGRLGVPILTRLMRVTTAMNQLTVLGAAAMLNEEHVAAARTLQQQGDQGRQGASTSNHSEFGEVSHRRGHG